MDKVNYTPAEAYSTELGDNVRAEIEQASGRTGVPSENLQKLALSRPELYEALVCDAPAIAAVNAFVQYANKVLANVPQDTRDNFLANCKCMKNQGPVWEALVG